MLRWMFLLLMLQLLLRTLFWHHNQAFFDKGTTTDRIWIYWWGLQMDLSALAWLNFPFFILFYAASYLPASQKPVVWSVLAIGILLNTAGLALGIIDIGYYPFSKHRTNSDLLYVLKDSLAGWRRLLTKYWGLVVVFLTGAAAIFFSAARIYPSTPDNLNRKARLTGQLLGLALLMVLARGWQARPLIPASPLLQIAPHQLPLAQNSIGSFGYSLVRKQDQLMVKKYFPDDSLNQLVLSHQHCCAGHDEADSMIKKNVVICILESFSRFYLQSGPLRARTPFFDSLISKSINFPNAYANGFSSNQGIVAILGGLPALLDEPFYHSVYANTSLNGIGNLLLSKGYRTHFFMGTDRDHFGFEKFGRMAGIEHFHGRQEFGDDQFFDGNWGIYDGPFLQFTAAALAGERQPFMAVIYNLSSHPPFSIPAAETARFNLPPQPPAQRSISYVDDAFRQFFSICRLQPWFKQTIFVFCADHYLYPEDGSPANPVAASAIPLFIYDPGLDSGLVQKGLISQVDITPTVLHLLHFSGDYSGFGTDVLDSSSAKENVAVNKYGSLYQIISREFALAYDGLNERPVSLFNFPADPALSRNLIDSAAQLQTRINMQRQLQAVLQRFSKSLLDRNLASP